MGKDTRVHNLYIKEDIWELLLKAKKRTGKSVSWLLTHGFEYWLKNNPKELEDLAEEMVSIMAIREAKQRERESGDYLGSFSKEQRKIAWIKETVEDKKLQNILIDRTKENYAKSRNGAEKKLRKEAEKPKKRSLEELRKLFKEAKKKERFPEGAFTSLKASAIKRDAERYGVSFREGMRIAQERRKKQEKRGD